MRIVMITNVFVDVDEKYEYLGKIGIIEKVNSYGGVNRHYIPTISEDVYFFEGEFAEINLSKLSELLDKHIKQLSEEDKNTIYTELFCK